MRCPVDVDVDLVMTERQGVEIDYCPTCRGVWLDRGELDKILDRAAALPPVAGSLPAGHAAGHVPGEGGHGAGYEPVPAPGRAPGWSEPGYGTGAPGPGGYDTGLGSRAGAYRQDRDDDRGDRDDRGRYGDDRGGYGDDRSRYGDDRSRYARQGEQRRPRRKESWLGDLLDF